MSKLIPLNDSLIVGLEARNLSMQFGSNLALNDLNFTVNKGEVFCLLGQNDSLNTITT